MKRILLPIVACATLLSVAACRGYVPGDIKGGEETGTMAGPGDSVHSVGSDKADGHGDPVAGGQRDFDVRQVYTKADTALTSHPY